MISEKVTEELTEHEQLVGTITGNTLFLSGEKPMWITSLQGTGDFVKNVNIKSTASEAPNHSEVIRMARHMPNLKFQGKRNFPSFSY